MYRGRGISTAKSSGFTVVETLVFLAVSAALFVSAMLLVGGRQGKAQFENAVRNFETNLIDVANDVANGYYQSSNQIQCSASGGIPNPSLVGFGTKDPGTNEDCIFMGRAIMPTNDAPAEDFDTYSLVGARERAGGTSIFANQETNDVKTIGEANPRLLKFPAVFTTTHIGNGASVECIKVDTGTGFVAGPGGCTRAGIAFITNVGGGLAASNSGRSGSGIQAVLYAYKDLANYSTAALETKVNSTTPTDYATLAKSVTVCLKSGTTSQFGLIKIGTDGSSSLTISSEIRSSCP